MVALETSHVDAIFTLSLEGALERAVTHDEPTLGERPIFCIESTIPSDLQGVIRAKVLPGMPELSQFLQRRMRDAGFLESAGSCGGR